MLRNIVKKFITLQDERNIWKNSQFEGIDRLKIDYVGKIGEQYLHQLLSKLNISNDINGLKNRKVGGGKGDGLINNKYVEIKTARLGIGNSFQHELGENPWNADFMLFLDISPNDIYLTILPNLTLEEYEMGCKYSSFPTKKITKRKNKGNFKFDTTINLLKKNKTNTIIISKKEDEEIKDFIYSIIK